MTLIMIIIIYYLLFREKHLCNESDLFKPFFREICAKEIKNIDKICTKEI